jgi:hypothetical protein
MALDASVPCSEQSLKAGEPLRGTALADVDVWLLLEHPGKWEADIADTPLPEVTRAWLDRLGTELPRSRLLFIRRDRPVRALSFYVAVTAPHRSVHRFMVQTHEELASLDIASVVSGGTEAAEAQGGERSRSLYLVCAHGRRDRCCARKGAALYRALDALELDGDLWQSSHQGGHRFAATMLYLPYGVHYGRLDASDATGVAQAHARGRIYDLDRYRGLASLSLPQQTAEAWLREQLDEMRIDGLELLQDGDLDDDEHHFAHFRAKNRSEHRVVVTGRQGKQLRLASCTAEAPTPFAFYEVVRYEAHTRGSGTVSSL